MTDIRVNDFAPLIRRSDVHGISRPSLSYWEDAWIRLKTNTRAIASLYIVISLLAFTTDVSGLDDVLLVFFFFLFASSSFLFST